MPKKKAEKKTALKKEKAQAKTKTASKKKSSKEAKGRLIVSQEEKDEIDDKQDIEENLNLDRRERQITEIPITEDIQVCMIL